MNQFPSYFKFNYCPLERQFCFKMHHHPAYVKIIMFNGNGPLKAPITTYWSRIGAQNNYNVYMMTCDKGNRGVGGSLGYSLGREDGINHKVSENKSFHVKSNWFLNELTKGAVTIEMGSLLQSLMTRTAKNVFLRRCRLGPRRTYFGRKGPPACPSVVIRPQIELMMPTHSRIWCWQKTLRREKNSHLPTGIDLTIRTMQNLPWDWWPMDFLTRCFWVERNAK